MTAIPEYERLRKENLKSEASFSYDDNEATMTTTTTGAGGAAQLVECLSTMHEVLG